MLEQNNKRSLWEILVPATIDDEQVPMSHHKFWDETVREISGGLTILKTAKGHWISPKGDLFIEPMVPVRLLCTPEEIEQIADLTAEHYQQEAIMFYCISNEVIIKHY